MFRDTTIEECLEILAGYHEKHIFDAELLDTCDISLIRSLGKQVFQGTALTDRQFELAKSKCVKYNTILKDFDINEIAFDNLRMPLREIDRSRYVRIEEKDPTNKLIAVRFTFSKKLINALEALRTREVSYDKTNKIHYYPYDERTIFDVIKLLEGKNFEVEERIQKIYRELLHMSQNKKDYVPGIYGLKLKNFTNKAVDVMIKDIGEPTEKNLPLYADRQMMYGVDHIDKEDLQSSVKALNILTKKIITRTKTHIFVNKDTYSYNMLAESLLELLRWPILVVCNDRFPLNDIQPINETFKGIFPIESSAVLFRETNDTADGQEINNYIKDKKLNNALDTNSKIVYIKNDKIPKPMLTHEWMPRVIIFSGSKNSSQKLKAFTNETDLVIHYDTDISPFHRDVEKI